MKSRLAQLVERVTSNDEVSRSNRLTGIISVYLDTFPRALFLPVEGFHEGSFNGIQPQIILVIFSSKGSNKKPFSRQQIPHSKSSPGAKKDAVYPSDGNAGLVQLVANHRR